MSLNVLSAWRRAATLLVCLLLLVTGTSYLHAQTNTGTIEGSVMDQTGKNIKGAAAAAIDAAGHVRNVATDARGAFVFEGLPAGVYTVQVSAPGFATETRNIVKVTPDATESLRFKMSIASVSQEVKVEAEADNSLASRLSPVKSVLDAGSARTEITSQYVENFTQSVTDFADIVQAAPGTVSWSTNGVGLGQAKIYFRGFVDDDYTMTWDGVPFNDSNDPSHHSWAYVPAPAIGYVDFDRSPGTAADMGPSNYGGSIHMFSPELHPQRSFRISESYGSFNTNQILGEYYSGLFGPGKKANFWLEGHHMTSDGYQTGNDQQRTAATAKFTYDFSNRSHLAAISTVVLVDSNTPDGDPYRFQIAQHGDNFLLQTNRYNKDGSLNGLYNKFYNYHVPTDFEIVTYTHDWGKGWRLELKPYAYAYSNHQHFNSNQYSESGDDNGNLTGNPITPTSGLDKLNQYVKGGAIAHLSDASKYGVFRAGGWYEYTGTQRYQIASNPLTWQDSNLIGKIKFHESFITRSEQPYAEYQFVAIPHLTVTAGVKDAYYNMTVKQYASAKKVGLLGCKATDTTTSCTNYVIHEKGYNNVLPSVEVNYRIHNNWSVYGQYGKGSIIPFSSVFDVTGAQVQVAPPPTVASTYQGGTVLKLNRVSMDADVYHIHFVNQYSSYTNKDVNSPDYDVTYYYATPPSNTNGLEGEANIAFGRGVSLFLNGTLGEAKYEAAAATAATATAPAQAASPSAWVALAPHDTETIAPTYQRGGWNIGFFNKRVGTRWEDDGAYHQNVKLDPFWISNLFFNYTIRNGSRFDNSKIKLSFGNLFDQHNLVDLSPANGVSGNGVLYTPDSLDTLQLLPGRSVMVSFQLGFGPKGR